MSCLSFHKLWLLIACIEPSVIIHAQESNPLPKAKHQFVVVCHRGDHTQAPENTLAAFSNAIKAGADYVEIDLRTTVDSQLVIMHDASVNRMTNDTGLINNMTAEKLRTLKVKDKIHPEWGEFDIPLFSEVLQLCKDRIYIYLDFKNADPSVAYKEIKRYGMDRQLIVYINTAQQFVQWRSAAPSMPLMVSLPGNIRDTTAMINFLNRVKPDLLDGNYDQYTGDMVTTARRMGYTVIPDIQAPDESPVLWTKALKKGFIGLQTDHPGELITYLKQQP